MVLLLDRSSTFIIHTHTQFVSTTLDRLCLLYRTVVDIAPPGTGSSTVFPLIEAYMFYFIKSYFIDFYSNRTRVWADIIIALHNWEISVK